VLDDLLGRSRGSRVALLRSGAPWVYLTGPRLSRLTPRLSGALPRCLEWHFIHPASAPSGCSAAPRENSAQ
jgi:hypothetical protein